MGSANTTFSFSHEKWTDLKADGLIVPVFKKPGANGANKNGKGQKSPDPKDVLVIGDALKALDKALQGMIFAAAAEEKFDGGSGKVLSFRKTPKDQVSARRIILVGLGEAGKLKPQQLDSAIQRALGPVLALSEFATAAIVLPESSALDPVVGIQTIVDAVFQATYRSAESKDKPPALNKILLVADRAPSAAEKAALVSGEALAKGRSRTKDLVNKPSNLKTTNTLVEAAKTIGKLPGLKTTVQANTDWIQKNMPCFYTVAQGSLASDPPKFITVEYRPNGARAKKKIALVGKSVIFDTGGYQVKTGNGMNTMKGDMTGGAVVLSVMEALSALKPANIEVTAYLAATPNKIDSDAMIPDSIVDTTCGKKVEIRHTDAEGRLTLIDAVAKAAETKPDEIITIATLTGSASLAVGRSIALMGSDEALVERVNRAGRFLGEPIQVLEVLEDDYDSIKSKLDGADLINTSHKRERGAQSAGAFVMSGAPEGLPMAHLDIAGADMTADEKATGIGFRTLLQYLLQEDAQTAPRQTVKATASPVKAAAATAKPAARKPAAKPAVKAKSAKPAVKKPVATKKK